MPTYTDAHIADGLVICNTRELGFGSARVSPDASTIGAGADWTGAGVTVADGQVISQSDTCWPGTLMISDARSGPIAFAAPAAIAGTVRLADGSPAARRVLLLAGASHLPVADTVSSADGRYRFDGLVAGDVFAVLVVPAPGDGANAVILDGVVAAVLG